MGAGRMTERFHLARGTFGKWGVGVHVDELKATTFLVCFSGTLLVSGAFLPPGGTGLQCDCGQSALEETGPNQPSEAPLPAVEEGAASAAERVVLQPAGDDLVSGTETAVGPWW